MSNVVAGIGIDLAAIEIGRAVAVVAVVAIDATVVGNGAFPLPGARTYSAQTC